MIYGLWIFGAMFIAGWYLAIRYFLLERALREAGRELREISGSMEQNRILRLSLPDRGLGELLETINAALEAMRRERLTDERREKAFQEQIENISHDLRTPLTVLLGYLKMLKRQLHAVSREGPAPEVWQETTEALEAMERNARRLEKLVAEFYTYSQVWAGEEEMELEAADACRILRESLADNYKMLERLSLKAELPEHSVTVSGNREALERIFLNVLQNAGRYAKSQLWIRMEDRGDGQIRFFFENDGAEMEKEDLSHVFDRFYKGDLARNKGGSGLGLAIAKALAERMAGSLTGEIEEGGDRICFILTLRKTIVIL